MENLLRRDKAHDKVRAKYGSVAAFCRAHSFNAQVYYAAVRGARGSDKGRPAVETARVIDTLRSEGLLMAGEAKSA